MLEEKKDASVKPQNEKPANKWVWQAVQVTGKNNIVTNTKNLVWINGELFPKDEHLNI